MSLVQNRSSPKEFWKLLKRNTKANIYSCASISPFEFYNYFKSLLFDNTAPALIYDENEDLGKPYADCLNNPICLSEIKDAITSLANGKSAGIDGLPYEFYKVKLHEIPPILHKLFNAVMSTGNFPISWSQSIICPIHKSGSIDDPANYRGISFTKTMYKIFSGIISSRLCKWAEDNNIIDEAQAGFRRNYSTVDNLFSL